MSFEDGLYKSLGPQAVKEPESWKVLLWGEGTPILVADSIGNRRVWARFSLPSVELAMGVRRYVNECSLGCLRICKAYSRSYPICRSRATREAFIITPVAQAGHRASERVNAVAGHLSFCRAKRRHSSRHWAMRRRWCDWRGTHQKFR